MNSIERKQSDATIKPKVLFLLHAMNVGGVEKALLGLLSALPIDKLNIHVGLLRKEGELLNEIPKGVTVHEINVYNKYMREINDPPLQYIRSYAKKGQLISAISFLIIHLLFKITNSRYWFYKFLLRNEPEYAEKYDVAVSFAGPSQMMDYYICQKVQASVKCCWIHFDVSKFGIDQGMAKRLYKTFKKIFIVSESGKRIFDEMFPSLCNRTQVFRNVVSSSDIVSQSFASSALPEVCSGGVKLLTVGRISIEKGQREALKALKIMTENGINVYWYFVGDGKDKNYCEKMAKELGIAHRAIFVGNKANPYVYMRTCDVYVQPSRHEGFCLTLAEALCFEMPIVVTDFTGAREQLRNRTNSIVCGMGENAIAEAIVKGMKMPKCRAILSNTTSVKPFMELVEGSMA